MIKINYDEFIEKNGYLILERFIKTLEKIMTILITNHDSKESLIKVQDYLKHGFFFKPAGALLLKANLLTLHQNKDRNFIQKFLKYHMITG